MLLRAQSLLFIAFGVVAVVGLVLLGVDVYKSVKTGPSWKRRLLRAGLALLGLLGGWFFRPKPEPIMTCYMPLPMECSIGCDLSQQLPLLEKLGAQEKLDPNVVRKVLVKAEQELNRISDPALASRMPGPEYTKLEKIRAAAEPVVKRLRKRIGPETGALEKSADWKLLVDCWKVAVEDKNLKRKGDAISDARLALGRLGGAGLLTSQESALLGMELARIRRERVDAAACYDSIELPPSEESVERLTKRLPLLTELAAGGKVRPGALARVIAAVEADLKVLENPKPGAPAGREGKRARMLCRNVRAQLAKLKALTKGEK